MKLGFSSPLSCIMGSRADRFMASSQLRGDTIVTSPLLGSIRTGMNGAEVEPPNDTLVGADFGLLRLPGVTSAPCGGIEGDWGVVAELRRSENVVAAGSFCFLFSA